MSRGVVREVEDAVKDRRKQAVNRELPRKAHLIARFLEGDEGDDRTYNAYQLNGVLDWLRGHDRGDIVKVDHLYKDRDAGIEVGSGTHGSCIYSGGPMMPKDVGIWSYTQVYYEGELVLKADTMYDSGFPGHGPETERTRPGQIHIYRPGDWEDELDALIDDAEAAYVEEKAYDAAGRFGASP